MENWKIEEAKRIAEEIRSNGYWVPELLKKLCELAGIAEEWQAADGDTFEDVAFKAAEILNVELI